MAETLWIALAGVSMLGAAWMGALYLRRSAALAGYDEIKTRLEAAEKEAREKIAAESRLALAEETIVALRAERDAALAARAEAQEARHLAEREAALARQAEREALNRMGEWDKTRAQMLESAKAALVETSGTVAATLIENHKRENEAARKEREEENRKASATIFERFESVTKIVTVLHSDVEASRKTSETVWRALASPGGAGKFAEVGLENTLKSFGLEPGRDFMMQYSVESEEGARLRPDAVVFLPGDTVMVIDSKASKFLLELEEAEAGDATTQALANLSRTMGEHLKALASKQYQAAVLAGYKEAGRGHQIKRMLNIMYLPSDGAVEKVRMADPGFSERAAKAEIIPAGPGLLAGIISFACKEINLGRQKENQEHIIAAVGDLMESTAVLVEYVGSMGKSARATAEHFSKLASSVNTRLLPRMRKLVDLGVRPSRNRALPEPVRGYKVESSDTLIIEAEPAGEAPKKLETETA